MTPQDIENSFKLRKQFKDQTGDDWGNEQGEPNIDYVLWLEKRLLDLIDKEIML